MVGLGIAQTHRKKARAALAHELNALEPHAQAERLLALLHLRTGPFSLTRFVRRLERHLGTSIRLVPVDCPPQAYGALVELDRGFVVTYRRNAAPLLRRSVIYHELAHLVLDHNAARRSNKYERAAELLGQTLLQHSLGVRDHKPAPTALDQRLAAFFG